MLEMFIATSVLLGQNLFARVYEGTCSKYGWSITETRDYGFVVAGHTHEFGMGGPDFIVFRLDPTGNPIWVKTYNNGGSGVLNYARPIIQTTRDPGYVFAGFTGAGGTDFLIIKTDEDGNLRWAKTFGGPADDWPYSITETPDGGLAIVGWTASFGAGGFDFLILKLGEGGEPHWALSFGGSGEDIACASTMLGDGELIVVGSTNSFGFGGYEGLVISLDHRTGQFRWGVTLGWERDEFLSSVVCEAGAHLVVAGTTNSRGSGGSDVLVVKLDPGGNPVWSRIIGGTNDEPIFWPPSGEPIVDLAYTQDGFVIGGASRSFGASGDDDDLFLFKLDLAGEPRWAKIFGTVGKDYVHFVAPTSDGGFAIAGTARSYANPGTEDLMVMKLNWDGAYEGCILEANPGRLDDPPRINLVEDFSRSLPVDVGDPDIRTFDAFPYTRSLCDPLYEKVGEEVPDKGCPKVTCAPAPKAAIFISNETMSISIYSADGRLVRSGQLEKGENRIPLEIGVYIWQAGPYKGKAVVR